MARHKICVFRQGEEKEDVLERDIEDEEAELEAAAVLSAKDAEDDCLVLEGDNDEDVLVVNSETELIASTPAQTPKFEIISADETGYINNENYH